MSNVQSYNALIDRFKAFASGHFILKRFSHGQIEVSDLEKFGEYPFMHVVPSNVTYAKGMKTFSFQIVLADLPRDKDDKTEYQREVLSDLQRIAEDLIAEITNHRVLFGDLITVNNVSLEPFLEEFQHTLTGWTISLDLLVPYYWDACSIPAEWNDMFESSTGGTGSILTFIDSITRDENGNVSLVNDEAEPSPNYYYGTNDEGVRGWYLLTDEVGLTCVTLPSCQTIIDIEAAIDLLQQDVIDLNADVALKANTDDLGATAFSNDYNDLDNLPTIPAAQVNSDWNATSGVAQILNKPTIPDVSGFVPYTGATQDVDLGTHDIYTNKVFLFDEPNDNHGSIHYTDGDFHIEDADGHKLLVIEDGFMQLHLTDTIQSNLFTTSLTQTRDHYLPNQSGTIALTSDIPAAQIQSNWTQANNAALDFIKNKPTIPAAQVNSDWNATSGVAQILNKPTIPSIAGLVPETRTLTINGTTQDLSANRTFTIASNPGTVTSVAALTLGTTGTDLSSTVANGTSTPVITLNVPTASATNRGALSSTDWSTFNGKFTLPSLTSGSVLFSNGTTIAQSNANLFWDNTNGRLGVGTATPSFGLDVNGTARVTSSIQASSFLTNASTGVGLSSPATAIRISTNDSGANIIANAVPFFTFGNNGTAITRTTGTGKWFEVTSFVSFAPTSGTCTMDWTSISPTINQTGGANGITRGLYINPTLTSAADFRAIETTNGKVIFGGTGNVLIGTTTDAGFKLDVNGTARVVTSITTPLLRGAVNSATHHITFEDSGFLGRGTIFKLPNEGNDFKFQHASNYSFSIGYSTSTPIQNGAAWFGWTTSLPIVNASAQVQIDSTTKGFLPPRMTTTQKNAITTPAAGLVVYDTTLGKLCVRTAAAWETITSV